MTSRLTRLDVDAEALVGMREAARKVQKILDEYNVLPGVISMTPRTRKALRGRQRHAVKAGRTHYG